MPKFFRIATVVILLLWMLLIFSLSAENATNSSKSSGRIITAIVRVFYSEFDELSAREKAEIIEPAQFIVRKAAHFSLYAILGAFAFLSVVTYKKLSLKLRAVASVFFCLLYSVSDEIHQLYVPGRSGEIRDVCIDFCGSVLSITILFLCIKFSKVNFIKNNT